MSRGMMISILFSTIISATSCGEKSSVELSSEAIAAIEADVRQAAMDHINAKDARTALGHYTPDAMVASLGFVYPSFDSLASDVKSFYSTIQTVDRAEFRDIQVIVINDDAAFLTAKFHWISKDTSDTFLDLAGAWSALYIRDNATWKIRAVHESVLPQNN